MDNANISQYSNAFVFSVIIGLLVGLVVAAVILYVTKKDGSIKAKYDERQALARGSAFKYAFAFLSISGAIVNLLLPMLMIDMGSDMTQLINIICISVSLLIFIGYCIFHDAYFALNEKRTRVMIAFFIVFIFNGCVAAAWLSGICTIFPGMPIFVRYLNLICSVIFLILFIMLYIKSAIDGNKSLGEGVDDDEES